ncbi:MAG: pyrimidine 5'-nucleotidase [Rhodospirillaceae bacterium]|nr:pyrimidine 5'-nucleotidase [Rhodospirillaceae bacterium]|tara:strand:- start:11444 stop:12133 length:690 start_codon:yes stop_codon:yes gene_type:complete
MNDPKQLPFDEIETWIFDLDNTLYPVTKRLLAHIDEHMGGFVAKYLGITREEAHQVQKSYFRKYGLTLRGLMIHDGLDPAQYFEEMTPMDLNEVDPNPALGTEIANLKGRKIIYTNASAHHAKLVLDRMGFEPDVFEVIFDIQAANYIPKPAIESYQVLCDIYSIDPGRAVMIDDIVRNLEPAAELGMKTVWKKSNADWAQDIEIESYIDLVVEDLQSWVASVLETSQA